jgi:phosphomannomutase/phosphoglucomutase
MNSSLAALACNQGLALWYGFDGNGGITVSEWLGYHDALMALAHVLPSLSAARARLAAEAALGLDTCHQLLPCRDENKAQVMRRLLEHFENYESEVNDGVKLKTDSGWVVVRLCAGREAIEVFKCGRHAGGRSEVECLFTEVLQNLMRWVGEAG